MFGWAFGNHVAAKIMASSPQMQLYLLLPKTMVSLTHHQSKHTTNWGDLIKGLNVIEGSCKTGELNSGKTKYIGEFSKRIK